ncbi:helix-turn-helix domain-containing protein [Alkalicoccobacillus porphyridii]|nr:helix-turn-helix domain-containing protein [Alkalicoccobacillus porphyridii]
MNNSIGIEIRSLRTRQGMSQENISSLLVSQSAISKIENGKYIPNVNVLESVASKLGVPVEHFLSLNNHYNNDFIETTYEIIEQLSLTEAYEELYNITTKTIKYGQSVSLPSWFRNYVLIHQIFSEFQCNKKDAKSAFTNLKSLVNSLSIEHSIQTKLHLYLGILHSHVKAFSYSNTIDYFKKSLTFVEGIKGKNTYLHKKTLKIHILYQKVLIELHYHHYDAALNDIKEGLQLSKTYACTAYVGQFLYFKGLCLEKKGKSKKDVLINYQYGHLFANFIDSPFKKLLLDKLSSGKENSYESFR